MDVDNDDCATLNNVEIEICHNPLEGNISMCVVRTFTLKEPKGNVSITYFVHFYVLGDVYSGMLQH